MNKKAILVIAVIAIAVIAAVMIFTHSGEKETDTRVIVEIGDKSYTAVLYDTDAAKEFAERLPVTIEMNELNGNEKYYNFDEAFTRNDKPAGNIRKGDIKLYGDNCVVLFYDSFLSTYSYTSIGYIEDTAGLENAVGTGNVTVTFRAENESSKESSLETSDIGSFEANSVSTTTENTEYVPEPVETTSTTTTTTTTTQPQPITEVNTMKININGTDYTAHFYDTAAAEEFKAMLPLTLDMSELNGNEKFIYLDTSFSTESESVGYINKGELMLYGSSCLVLFYDSFSTPYSYTRLGYIDDPDGLESAVGSGDVTITFSAE